MILLTGPSGAGKSTLARGLEARGWRRLDGDALAKSLYVPGGPLMRALAREFGSGIVRPDGSLDAVRLGEIVFPSLARRKVLNRLVYPRFLRALRAQVREARAKGRALVADVAVYFDLGAPALGLPVVLVTAPLALRVARLKALGVEPRRAAARARSLRFGPRQRREADLVLDGRRPRRTLLAQVLDFVQGNRAGRPQGGPYAGRH